MRLPSRPSTRTPSSVSRLGDAKVPEITVLFWVIKVLTTGMGEATSDYLAGRNVLLAAVVGLLGFVAAMVWQFRTRRYHPWAYWFAVAMVAVFGTMAADGLHKVVGIPYVITTVGYAVVLAAVFLAWRRTEGTLSIHSIDTRRRERFYWFAVLATFALGTAAGDLTAFTLHLGYAASLVLFAVAIVVPALAYRRGVMSAMPAFWTAYVLTRPLGASAADWLGKPASLHGLGLGDGTVALASAIVIAALVGYCARTSREVQAARSRVAVSGASRSGQQSLAPATETQL